MGSSGTSSSGLTLAVAAGWLDDDAADEALRAADADAAADPARVALAAPLLEASSWPCPQPDNPSAKSIAAT